jgi:hypothetical protein
MSDNPRRPIEWRDGDTRTVAMIIDDIWNAIRTTLIHDDRDMPEMVRWQLVEYDDISWLPFCQILGIT